MKYSKNRSISKKIAKTLLRLSIIIIALPIAYFLLNQNDTLYHASVYFPYKWALLFPIALFFIYVALMIEMLKNKYNKIEINGLFSVSAAILTIYLLMLYSRMFMPIG